jgi:hypothetical protein
VLPKIGSPQIRRAYRFLIEAERAGRLLTGADLEAASGWSAKTTKAYLSKKLTPFLRKEAQGLKASGVRQLTEEAFCRWFSQKASLASEPRKPLLDPRTEGLVQKARDAALAAVQHYNNPTTVFRSGNFIVLMFIAYTALFHAVFERRGVAYQELDKKTNRPKLKNGEPLLWDALRCARVYDPNPTSPMVANLGLLFPIRHKMESVPNRGLCARRGGG